MTAGTRKKGRKSIPRHHPTGRKKKGEKRKNSGLRKKKRKRKNGRNPSFTIQKEGKKKEKRNFRS